MMSMTSSCLVKKEYTHLFDFNDLLEFIDFNRLQYYHISFNGKIIAIATDTTLILITYDNDYNNNNDHNFNADDNDDDYNAAIDNDGINLVIDFNNSDENKPTCVEWIYDNIVCVGFQSGRIICFNCQGIEVFVFNTSLPSSSSTSSSTSSSSSSSTLSSSSSVENIKLGMSMINTTKHQNDVVPSIWIICKNGLLVSIPLSNILEQKKDLIMAYQLTSQSTYRDVVLYPYIYYNSPSSSSDIVAQMEMDNDDDDATIYPNHAIVLI